MAQKRTTLRDLCDEDKERVSRLVKQVGTLTEERDSLVAQCETLKKEKDDATRRLLDDNKAISDDFESFFYLDYILMCQY